MPMGTDRVYVRILVSTMHTM